MDDWCLWSLVAFLRALTLLAWLPGPRRPSANAPGEEVVTAAVYCRALPRRRPT